LRPDSDNPQFMRPVIVNRFATLIYYEEKAQVLLVPYSIWATNAWKRRERAHFKN